MERDCRIPECTIASGEGWEPARQNDRMASPTGRGSRLASLARGAAFSGGAVLLLLWWLSDPTAPLLAFGALTLFCAGVFYRRIRAAYGTLAVLFLNVVALLVVIEVGANAVVVTATLPAVKALIARFTGQPNDLLRYYAALPYYVEQPWSGLYWDELGAALRKVYRPYVLWRSPAFSGETINIDEQGRRRTPGSACTPGSYRVLAFGGSAMWGWGAPDWGTVPVYLLEELQAARGEPVCVINFAEQAYVSTQSTIQLLERLQAGGRPDLVVFYDGVNEVLAASQTDRPGLHQNYEEIARRFDGKGHPLAEWTRTLGSMRLAHELLSRVSGPDGKREPGPSPERLADAVVGTYLVNLETVQSWAGVYGFDFHFFWQPHILMGSKPLTWEETEMIDGLEWTLKMDDELRGLFQATYARIQVEAETRDQLGYLAGVFDDVDQQIWIDTWGHTTPPGNRLVAREMLRHIRDEDSAKGSR
jgi:hypothetical protein